MAETKANTSQQEVLALVIDRETSSEVSRINKEIGQSIYYQFPRHRFHRLNDQDRLMDEFGKTYDQERTKVALKQDSSYENLLIEYTQLKLYLHDLRRSCYYRGDPYVEREDVDVKGIMDRCDELKQMIKERRRVIRFAAWGDMEPNRVTAFDKPLLYAFDDYTCSHSKPISDDESEDCPLKGEHWFHDKPYCRTHLGEARRQFKLERRRNRIRWVCMKEPKCQNRVPHVHEFGRLLYT